MSTKNETKRKETFAQQISTSVCNEYPAKDNPWNSSKVEVRGYDQLELTRRKSFVENVWLIIRSEFPSREELENFEKLLTFLSCPSPRSSESRAVMNASIAKTHIEHWLPIGLNVASGNYGGAQEVFHSCKLISKAYNKKQSPKQLAEQCKSDYDSDDSEILVPGFGLSHGSVDNYLEEIVGSFSLRESQKFAWCLSFREALAPEFGWRKAGVTASALFALGFSPVQTVGIFQMAILPGLIAYGDEKANGKLTDMPFLKDEDYIIEMPSGELL